MKFAICLGLAAGLVLAGCSGGSDQPAKSSPTSASGSNAADNSSSYLGALGKAQQSAVKTADVASLTQAIQAFSVDKGRYPNDLNELVQDKYLSHLPAAPYGMTYSYDASSGTVKVVKQ